MGNHNLVLFDVAEKNVLQPLKRLIRNEDYPILQAFFARTGDALRLEVGRQQKAIRDQVPHFTTIIDLVEVSCRNPSTLLGHAFECLYQIGTVLAWCHRKNEWLQWSEEGPLRIGAYGTGCLAASALAVSETPAQLAEVGSIFTVLCFRLAVHEQGLSKLLVKEKRNVALPPVSADVEQLLNNPTPFPLLSRRPQLVPIMTSDGIVFDFNDAEELANEVVFHLLDPKGSAESILKAISDMSLTSEIDLFHFYEGNTAQEVLKRFSECIPIRSVVPLFSEDVVPPQKTPSVPAENQIAIVGFSGRFPSAKDPEALWDILQSGKDVHRRVPINRFNIETHYDPTGKKPNTTTTPYGCFMDEPGLFDNQFFSVSPREAMQMDPVQRLALITAFEALQMAGIVPGRTPSTRNSRIGTFYGQASDDWRETNSSQNIDTYFIPGGIRAFTPGRINYHFKFSGPSYNVDTACSSSFAAMQFACQTLAKGECDTAIAGGVNVLTNPDIFTGLSRGHFLSPTGQCKAFDNSADGYCRADGVGSVIFKRLADALADNDNIYGVILGCQTNHSAEAASITRPHYGAQAALCQSILNSTGTDPNDIDYIEMHGTGTQAGDYHEIMSVSEVFAPSKRPHPLYVGTVKANIGHGEASAGVMSLIKVLMMLQKKTIPPHVGIQSGIVNERFPSDLKERNIRIPMRSIPWTRRSEDWKRLVFLNNFSAAGGNTAMLLQEGPTRVPASSTDPRSYFVVNVSGKNATSLKKNLENMAEYVAKNPGINLSDLSYTTTARRMTFACRSAVSGADIPSIEKQLRAAAGAHVKPTKPKKVAFVFTGQGRIYTELAKSLFETSSFFRNKILQFERLSATLGLPMFHKLLDGTMTSLEHESPLVVQLGTVCCQMALNDLIVALGIEPVAVIGHSLGEYAAFYAAGLLPAIEVIRLVGLRAKLMVNIIERGAYCMLAVKASESVVRSFATDSDIACINGPEETVLAGRTDKLIHLQQMLDARGFRTKLLDVPYAFHSSQMVPLMEPFERAVDKLSFTEGRASYISAFLGRVACSDDFSVRYFVRHMREPMQFLTAIQEAKQQGVINESTVWFEIGSHPICNALIKSILGSSITCVNSLRYGEDAWKTMSASLADLFNAGVDIDWQEYHREYENVHTMLDIPFYALTLQNFWISYENDWCLYKGKLPQSSVADAEPCAAKPRQFCLTVHQILEESAAQGVASILAETDLSHPRLRSLILGHLVNGCGLCPSAIYAEICLKLGKHLYAKLYGDSKNIGINVSSMAVPKPVILNADASKPQIIRISASLHGSLADFRFFTESNGKKSTHAQCVVKYGDPLKWTRKWNLNSHLVLGATHRLEDSRNQEVSRLNRGLVYKLFSSLVLYGDDYRGMDEVHMDAGQFESVATITFKTPDSEVNDYEIDPRWIDNLCHISGFTVNGNDRLSDADVYISHGWDSLRFGEPIEHKKTYKSYVRMTLTGEEGVRAGDVYILDGDRIIGVAGGVKFQAVPKRVLGFLLPNDAPKMPAPAKTTVPAIKPQPSIAQASQPAPKKTTTPKNSALDRAYKILAEECGAQLSELTDDALFADLGVDSLMSLTIISRLREELDIGLDSSFFLDNESISALKRTICTNEVPDSPSSDSSTSDDAQSGTFTPQGSEQSVGTEPEPSVQGSEVVAFIRSTIAEELGVGPSDIEDDSDLMEIGLDSLSVLSITAKLREALEDVTFPDDVLSCYETLNTLLKALGIKREVAPEPVPVPQRDPVPIVPSVQSPSVPLPQCRSFLLQGSPKTARTCIFYLPDGSGSATSYGPLPPVAPDVCVYSLCCPYMKIPEQWNSGIDGVIPLYLNEIRKRQPKGPYNIGGWSAGGVLAYEAAIQLLREGDKVSNLILIDSPCPVKLEPVPSKLFRFFDSIKVLGDRQTESPPYLIPHFEAMIRNLDRYEPEPFPIPASEQPKVIALWARRGICQDPSMPQPLREPTDPKVMDWLLNKRTDFGPNGWDQLLDASRFTCASIEADHFSMMIKPKVMELGQLLASEFARP
ncbi:Type I Iterative Polyketide synthase (PKS) [Ascosphaera aggregata]|nr:Type I Iterative Polyketide synthase (PKS) [Ascosphaera aggregata]